MNPVEAAIRAVCRELGADPDTWRGFEEVGRAALDGFISALPADVAEAVRAVMENHT